jgi:hypothetical protein
MNPNHQTNEVPPQDPTPSPHEPTEATPLDPRHRAASPHWDRLYDTIESAAAKLAMDPNALRARCRRAARRVAGYGIEAHLGAGVVAVKFGKSWRIRFPSP